MFKRCMDVSFALILLLLASPVLLACALAIKLDSKGPILFRQARMGRHFRPFRLLKLRTMEARSAGLPYTLGPDPRITRAGRWLRKFKLDEIPQLWNVLRGDMSLVGPRPVVPALAREFRPAYRQLLTARPGLTDPATLKYCRESEMLALVPDPLHCFKTVVTPDKLRISHAYQQQANIWSDFAVMAQTAVALVSNLVSPVPSNPPPASAPDPQTPHRLPTPA